MARPCSDFMNDDSCRFGEAECFYDHHPNIDPGTHATRTHQDYMIPSVKNDACQKCVMNFRQVGNELSPAAWIPVILILLQCDKVGRASGPNDPCSACRHFGGENCQTCVLQPITYNDHAWDQFRGRGGDGYTLAARRAMDDWNPPKSQKSKPKPKPLPMRDELLVSNWQGMSRDALLALPDFLPSGVRDCPRAYCTRPGDTRYHEKSVSYLLARDRWLSNGGKRKRDEEDIVEPTISRPRLGGTTLDPSAPAFVPGPRLISEYFDYDLGQTTYYWSNGWSTVTPINHRDAMLAPVVPVVSVPIIPVLVRVSNNVAGQHRRSHRCWRRRSRRRSHCCRTRHRRRSRPALEQVEIRQAGERPKTRFLGRGRRCAAINCSSSST